MSVTRLNAYRARPEEAAELRDALAAMLLLVRSMDGCSSAYILENKDEPDRFMVAEVWTSAEVHQESVKSIPAEAVALVHQHTEAAPIGAYYRVMGG